MSVCLYYRLSYSVHKSHLSASCYFVNYCPSGPTVFSHIISLIARFSERKITGHNMRAFIFCTTSSQMFLILRRIERDIDINLHTSSCKEPSFFSDFNEN